MYIVQTTGSNVGEDKVFSNAKGTGREGTIEDFNRTGMTRSKYKELKTSSLSVN